VTPFSWLGNSSGGKPGENCRVVPGSSEGDAHAAMRTPMSIKVISRRIDACNVTIKMEDGSLVQGKINLFAGEDVVQRVSDIFTKVIDPFIVVFDAAAEDKSGQVLILNKRNIAWIEPEDDQRQKQD